MHARIKHPKFARSLDHAKTLLCQFYDDEAGIVTADYVLITATIMSMGLSATTNINTGVDRLGAGIRDALASSQVVQLGELGYGVDRDGNTITAAAVQCPSDWIEQIAQTYDKDPSDLESDYEMYSNMSSAELMASLDRYTRDGGFGVERNEDNVQTISCALSARGLEVDVRVL